jgi:hypothetical protein
MNYEVSIYSALVILSICFIAYGTDSRIKLSRDFQCTESSIVDGKAECVKYERKVEK